MVIFRDCAARGESVMMTWPSLGIVEQARSSFGQPSASTTHRPQPA